ncbi:MAG: urea transporter [Candidatus Cloacimonetes bacterium]|nr:urea transporter [Candidatus Cloacimonadota bacterium]
MKKHILHFTDNLLYSFSTLLFMKSKIVGLILLCATLFNPNITILGIISWLTTFIFARFIGIKKDDVVHTIYTYNSLLVGFSIGFLFKISFLSILLAIGTSVLTVLLSYTLFSLFNYYFRLPVLNIPFTIVSTIIYLASVKYSALFVDSFYRHEMLNLTFLPASIHGLLRAFGVLLFSPYDIIGILVLLAILFYSRISFFIAVCSYYLGVSILALLKGSYAQAYADISTFNFILIGIAVGGIFLIPSKRSYTLAFVAVIVSVFILDAVTVFWSTFGIPIFTLPFNLVVLLFLYVLRNVGYPRINLYIKESPEKSLSNFLNFTKRFDYISPQPFLPFSGKWTVYQAFNDKWTHKGHWKYAYDFVITDDEDKTFQKKGLRLEDYYCYEKPVLSPVNGKVVDAYDLIKDNPVGIVNEKNNWGNYIIIYSDFGYYAEISHFQYRSLKVKKGDYVKFGEVLGLCGNSGYSPQPHIHMQVQYLPKLGSETVKFFLNNCKNNKMQCLEFKELRKNMKIEPVEKSRKKARILQFILDDEFSYAFYKNNKKIKDIKIKVCMDVDGSSFFNLDGTEDKLYFGIENNKFVLYSFSGKKNSLLKNFFYAIPKMPLSDESGLMWEENLPDNLFISNAGFQLFLKSFKHNAKNVKGKYKILNDYEMEGIIEKEKIQTKLIFDKIKGFKEITVKSLENEYKFVMNSNGGK